MKSGKLIFLIVAISRTTTARITRESIDDCEDLGTVRVYQATIQPNGHPSGRDWKKITEIRVGRGALVSWLGCDWLTRTPLNTHSRLREGAQVPGVGGFAVF